MNQIMTREDIERVLEELSALKCKTRKEVEEARVRFLGKKGEVTALFEEFRTIDKELKKEFGKTLNSSRRRRLQSTASATPFRTMPAQKAQQWI